MVVLGVQPIVPSRFKLLVFPFLIYSIVLFFDAIIGVFRGFNKLVNYINLASALNLFALFSIVTCGLYYNNKYRALWLFGIAYLLIELAIDFAYHRAWF